MKHLWSTSTLFRKPFVNSLAFMVLFPLTAKWVTSTCPPFAQWTLRHSFDLMNSTYPGGFDGLDEESNVRSNSNLWILTSRWLNVVLSGCNEYNALYRWLTVSADITVQSTFAMAGVTLGAANKIDLKILEFNTERDRFIYCLTGGSVLVPLRHSLF